MQQVGQKMKQKLSSHNSATGEKPYNIWAKLFSCVAKCQNKSIFEQYVQGVNLFDIRVRYNKKGILRCCHGLAVYDITLRDICMLFAHKAERPMIMVTYEGELSRESEGMFIDDVKQIVTLYPYVNLGYISVKKPEWHTIFAPFDQPSYVSNYTKIVGWKALLPFPRLWQWINCKKIKRTREEYPNKILMEDFV